jgi:general stress protein CsbA
MFNIHLFMKYFSLVLILFVLAACSKKEGDTNQTIINSDSSEVTGRLYVDAYDMNGNKLSNVTASLYLTYDDVKRNISLYTFTSNASGRIDFGYILQGNYYVTGVNNTASLHDTTVAQVLPKRIITRKLFLR